MSKIRIRTHANPLACPDPLEREEWTSELQEGRPLNLDMGCGQGFFITELAQNNPEENYIGIEVRKVMSDKVNEKIKDTKKIDKDEKIDNAICLSGNASISLKTLFKEKELKEIYINFPDPWMKPRYNKRRMIKEFVVGDLFTRLKDDGKIFLISDVKEVYDEFFELLKQKFKAVKYEEKKEKTYWQRWHENKGTEVYSSCFIK